MRYLLFAIPALLVGMQTSARADTIAPGTEIAVRTDAPILVQTWDRGRIYTARVSRDVIARDGNIAIPRGANAEVIIRQIGPREMALDLESITVNGRRYVVDTANGPVVDTSGNSDRYRNQNGGGVIGAIVGAISGSGDQIQTQGNEIRIPSGSVIRFQLRDPLHVAGWQDPGYTRDRYHYHRNGDFYR